MVRPVPYYSQVKDKGGKLLRTAPVAERKTFRFANIRHLQLQGRQNTTIKVSLRSF